MNTKNSRALKMAVASMEGLFGANIIQRAGKLPPLAVIPTGLPELDLALGAGGIPRGRIVEIFGPPSTGKTSLALQIARQVPAALFIDADHALSPEILTGSEALHTLAVDSLQDALRAVVTAAPAFDLVVLDTLTALPTQEELRMDIGERGVNPTSRVLASVLPRVSATLAKHGCTLLIVSQIREAPGIQYGNPERVPGGHALKHFASMRLNLRNTEHIRRGRDIVGQRIRAQVVKNKCGSPFREATLDLIYGSGFQMTADNRVEQLA